VVSVLIITNHRSLNKIFVSLSSSEFYRFFLFPATSQKGGFAKHLVGLESHFEKNNMAAVIYE
jgi:hypothetical protein